MIRRIQAWSSQRLTWYTIWAVALLAFIFIQSIAAIADSVRGLQFASAFSILQVSALFALVAIFIPKLKDWQIAILGLVVGAVSVAVILGRLEEPLSQLTSALQTYLPAWFESILDQALPAPDDSFLNSSWAIFWDGLLVTVERYWVWLAALPAAPRDLITANMLWGISLWAGIIWAIWLINKRQDPILGLTPLLVMIGTARSYGYADAQPLIPILGAGLAFTILTRQMVQEKSWLNGSINIPPNSRSRSYRSAMWLSAVLMTIAVIFSSPEFDQVIDDIRERAQARADELGEGEARLATGGQQSSTVSGPLEIITAATRGRLPNVNLIGSGPELSEEEVMHIKIQDERPENNPTYYFKSATYDLYSNRGWFTFDQGPVTYNAGVAVYPTYSINESLVYQEVTLLAEDSLNGYLMYTVGEISVADVRYHVSFHELFSNGTYVDYFAAVSEEKSYGAYTVVPYFDEDELRQAELDYPNWVLEKYLRLPNSITERVYDLAIELTATEPTAYDRAVAIESYLRTFEYTLDIPKNRPEDQDIADYFLFDLQKGYCDYYASSMVVLARAAGLPARFVVGYIAGTYDADQDLYIVTADQAHSWVEIYFPRYGWVPFEPTAGRPAIERIEDRGEVLIPEDDPNAPQQALEEEIEGVEPLVWGQLIGAAFLQTFKLLIITILAWAFFDQLSLRMLRGQKLFQAIYRRLKWFGEQIGIPDEDTDTPLEFTGRYMTQLDQFKSSRMGEWVFDKAPRRAAELIGLCSQAAYQATEPELSDTRWALQAWNRLRWALLVGAVIWFWRSLINKISPKKTNEALQKAS